MDRGQEFKLFISGFKKIKLRYLFLIIFYFLLFYQKIKTYKSSKPIARNKKLEFLVLSGRVSTVRQPINKTPGGNMSHEQKFYWEMRVDFGNKVEREKFPSTENFNYLTGLAQDIKIRNPQTRIEIVQISEEKVFSI